MQDLPASRFAARLGLSMPVALGLVGSGYDDLDWTRREYALALQAAETGRIGCGFLTWKLDQDASALDWVLDLAPAQRPGRCCCLLATRAPTHGALRPAARR